MTNCCGISSGCEPTQTKNQTCTGGNIKIVHNTLLMAANMKGGGRKKNTSSISLRTKNNTTGGSGVNAVRRITSDDSPATPDPPTPPHPYNPDKTGSYLRCANDGETS